MFHPSEMLRRRADRNAPSVPLHNVQASDEIASPTDTTAAPSPDRASDSNIGGVWGENDVGGPVRRDTALEDYEELRAELSKIETQRSRSSTRTRRSSVRPFRTASRNTTRTTRTGRTPARVQTARTEKTETEGGDLESGNESESTEEEFQLGAFLRDGHFEKRNEAGESTKRVGVLFKSLTVQGVGSTATFVKTLPSALLGTFGPDLYALVTRFVPSLHFGKKPPTRTLINDFTGAVRDGEMMLVLGKPGSGCTTFLKAIANDRSSYAAVTGDVSYGGIPAKEQAKYFRGEVNYNPENDQHFPTLNVWQTLKFSLMNKTKKHETSDIPVIVDALLKMFGISHTARTLVGNEYVRGISGGERKRVSIAETLATKSTVVCWDNSTRGLDASTALDYANSLRVMTDVSNRTTVVTLYQAGEQIYELMDKVLLIEEGRMLYQGPAEDAKRYFENLGFQCPDRQSTADFLTSICDPNERQFRPGHDQTTPKTPEELEIVFRKSEEYQNVLAEVTRYEAEIKATDCGLARQFEESVQQGKSKTVSKRSSYTVSFVRQVIACTKREFWLLWGDKTTLYTKAFIIIANGLIVGSLFFDQSSDTSGAFSRGGTALFSILFLGWLQLTELMKAVSGRVIIARHRDYAFYRPSAVVIARVMMDFPFLFLQTAVFGIILYFMTNLYVDVSKFFIYELFVYTSTICITALYRMFAALSPSIDDAVRFAGTALNILIIFLGYVIPKQTLVNDRIWFGWLYFVKNIHDMSWKFARQTFVLFHSPSYLLMIRDTITNYTVSKDPISYSFEAVLGNEFSGRVMECAPSMLVPQGPGILSPNQGCALTGSRPGGTNVTGEAYIGSTFSYSRSHLWRNFGVVIAFTVLYILITAAASEIFTFVEGGAGAIVFKKSKHADKIVQQAEKQDSLPADPEKAGHNGDATPSSSQTLTRESDDDTFHEISKSESIFTWSDVEYTVPYGNGTRKLLNKVNGYAKPGVMIALMGASGAGKTTLLNTLSQRQRMGVVSGSMIVDGRPLGSDFQRNTGFVEQMDLHEGTATVREAFEFSALLRQERDVPKAEKLAYVDTVINVLELEDMQDAVVSSLGVEQRKRLTIGVELAARPSLLLFLDEPTTGLDSQSAFSIVRFLKKLSRAGQAIVCTIHQPSSMLIQQFDMILALNPGGNTFYFGPVGDNGSAVVKYFADRGVECPPGKNVAEFILETAAKGGRRADGKRLNWNKEWRESRENQMLLEEIARINSTRSQLPAPEATSRHEFAASTSLQTTLLTKRLFIAYWRDPSYLYSKAFVSVIVGIFNGFTFYHLDNSLQSLQSRLFTSFLIILIPPIIVNGVVPKFYMNRALWEAREHPSRIYNWIAFCTANIVTEIPAAIIGSLIYWLLWYYPTNLPRDSSTAGYVFLMTMLFFLFQASWGQWICAFAPDFTVISNVLPFFFVIFSLFNGVVRPFPQFTPLWKYTLYYINPATYWIGGVLAATMPDLQVQCDPSEATYFIPPANQTCASFAGSWVQKAGGYLLDPSATDQCGWCQYRTGEEYLGTVNISGKDKWGYFGIFLGFCISNWALVYFFVYTVRVKGWTFGFGPLFGGLGKGVDAVAGWLKSMFERKEKKSEGRTVEV